MVATLHPYAAVNQIVAVDVLFLKSIIHGQNTGCATRMFPRSRGQASEMNK